MSLRTAKKNKWRAEKVIKEIVEILYKLSVWDTPILYTVP